MERKQAIKRAKKLYGEGHEPEEIGKILFDEGYASKRTGKALGVSGVNVFLHGHKWPSVNENLHPGKRSVIKPSRKPNNKERKYNALKTIMDLEMKPAEKTALVELIMDL